jgi:hypothetical protein
MNMVMNNDKRGGLFALNMPFGSLAQNNLGNALWDPAARTEGTKRAELPAQAVAAFRS